MRILLLFPLLFFSVSLLFSQDEFKTVKGILLDNRETMIGQVIYENGNFSNGVITDINGEFEIKLPKGKISILRIDFCFSSFFYEVEPGVTFVKININKRSQRKSKKLARLRKLNR